MRESDLSIQALTSLDEAGRRRLSSALADDLGASWEPEELDDFGAIPLRHRETGLSFLTIPGGTFEMGLTDGDIAALHEAELWDSDTASSFERWRRDVSPSRQVTVTPFLLAQAPLPSDVVERLSKGKHSGMYCYELARADANELVHAIGFRLPSEAELEWVIREGGRSHFAFDALDKLQKLGGDTERWPTRFGLRSAFETTWCADDFHADYVGAPLTSAPWMGGEPDGAARPGGVQPELVDEPHQRLGLLAVWRTARGHGRAQVRPALDLDLE